MVIIKLKMTTKQESRLVETVEELYQDRSLYSTPDMFSPPSERRPHVLRFELTQGCDYGKCTFCEGYKGVEFKVKTFEEYKQHVNEVWRRIGNGSHLARSLRRGFIGGGNALAVPSELLEKAVNYTSNNFHFNAEIPLGRNLRISLYGRTDSINEKKARGIFRLKQNGLQLIYWGVESGSTDVLKYVNKGYEQLDLLRAADVVHSAEIETSVMVMPGLGGIGFYDEHVRETAKVLGIIRPDFLTFMGVNPSPSSAYARKMNKETERGKNRALTDLELGKQMIDIIREMPQFFTKVGCFNTKIDQVGHNPITFDSETLIYEGDRELLTEDLMFFWELEKDIQAELAAENK